MSEDLKTIIHGHELNIQQMMLDLDKKLSIFNVSTDRIEIDASADMKTKIHTKEVNK
jgi:hypothetical protein